MAEYKVIGIDLAKRNFHVVGLDGDHKVTLKKKVSREEFFSGVFKELCQIRKKV